MLEYILYLCVGFYAVSIVSGCRCGMPDENDRYCANDYAIIATVTSSGLKVGNDVEYEISVVKCLKPHAKDSSVIAGKVYTHKDAAACGTTLKKGSKYLLSGRYRDNGFGRKEQYLGLCKIARELTQTENPTFSCP